MSQNELMAKIAFETSHRVREALRAVMELHKPNGRKCEKCGENVCWGCGEWGCGDDCDCTCHGIYPCPTIKAMEQEFR